jgi:hypothetical protein
MQTQFNEPGLADLLRDPLTEILMARDGITRDAMMDLLVLAARHHGIDLLPEPVSKDSRP